MPSTPIPEPPLPAPALPGVHTPVSHLMHTLPGVPEHTPPKLDTDAWTTVPRCRSNSHQTATYEPIALRTCLHTQNLFAALAEEDNTSNEVSLTTPLACPVLDTATGCQLEHQQLRQLPAYKDTWDTSYANELG